MKTAVGDPDPYEAAVIELRAMGAHVREVDDEVGGFWAIDFVPGGAWRTDARYGELLRAILPYHRPQPPKWSTDGF